METVTALPNTLTKENNVGKPPRPETRFHTSATIVEQYPQLAHLPAEQIADYVKALNMITERHLTGEYHR